MFKVIALIFLVTLANAREFQDTATVLSQIDQSPFGNTMLSAISLNMNSKNSDDDVIGLIDSILENLQTKEDANEKANKTNSKDCKDTITGLNEQIAEVKIAIKDLTKTIKEQTDIKKQAETDLSQAKQDYKEVNDAIAEGARTRKKAHEKWANEDYAQTVQITTLDEGTKLINHMIHGVAFAQIENRFNKVVEKLRNAKGTHAGLFKPLVTSLMQVATKINYENVMAILKLLANIRKSIVKVQQENRKEEEKAQEAWNKRLAMLSSQKKSLEDKKKRLQALIGTCSSIMTNSSKKLETAKFNLGDFEKSLNEKQVQCAKWSAEYMALMKEIDREQEILEKLKKYMQTKQKQVQDYINKRKAGAPKF